MTTKTETETEKPTVIPASDATTGSAMTQGKQVKEKKIIQVRFEMLKVDLENNRCIQQAKVDEYAKTIKETGVDKELLVKFDKEDGKYLVIDGNHRYLGCEKVIKAGGDAGWIKCEVDNTITDEKRLILQIRRNVNADLLPIDEATIYGKLIAKGYKQSDIAKETGKTPAWISNMMRLAEAPKRLQDLMKLGSISGTTVLIVAKNEDYNWENVIAIVDAAIVSKKDQLEQGATKRDKVSEKDLVAAGAKKITKVHRRIDKVIEVIKTEAAEAEADPATTKATVDLFKTIQKAADLLESDPEKFRKFVLTKLSLAT